MKTRLLSLAALFLSIGMNAQVASSDTVTFEVLTLQSDTFWDGSTTSADTVLRFGYYNVYEFSNSYSHSFGGYWSGGWAYSNMKDSVDGTYTNIYSARPAVGAEGSAIYMVGKDGSSIDNNYHDNVSNVNTHIKGFYITNSTYAALSMKNGDSFSKKFGGNSGNDADWFKLTIKSYDDYMGLTDSMDFYLADFRFNNNDSDYILKDWTYVDISSFQSNDSIVFQLTSSDNGLYGMNTPGYFCFDNLVYESDAAINENKQNQFQLYPNPSSDYVNVEMNALMNGSINIYDASGKQVYVQSLNALKTTVQVSDLEQGIYFITISGENFFTSNTFIKQ